MTEAAAAPGTQTPPSKKRRLVEDAGEVTNNNNNSRGQAGLQAASNGGLMSRPGPVPGHASGSASMTKSVRGPAASGDLDNYSDIRPDILEMIKEEQKVRFPEV